jgi:hypothetical protein
MPTAVHGTIEAGTGGDQPATRPQSRHRRKSLKKKSTTAEFDGFLRDFGLGLLHGTMPIR